MAIDFDMLWQDIQQCKNCQAHLPLPARPVLQASPRSRILIAAQAPGIRAHESATAFNDPSGDRLRQWLGVNRETFYNPDYFALVPMGFCYPGTGASGDLAPRPECAPLWRNALLERLSNTELTLVIGQYAQAWHLPNMGKTLTERVGRWAEVWPEILPLPHPSGRNNRWLAKNPWFEKEILPALRKRVADILAVK
ncbi:uracil-DNA glycosylase family protein [Gilvimarinus sp. DA14]|uniref:uracil-DNA glycosylase family protein n=1 Tax=Gilvimarinus sp. DA14 TaxID=2956798 RepID=UPI0020B8D5A7|nr:uracil-DNA glycosylase family protein [Gilvimarinus sp. DA14]UTF60347.1 uracil-DNA glycosylase family protein [Gilvimarinus sp. DA14]